MYLIRCTNKKTNVEDKEATDAVVEAQKLAEFIGAKITINEDRNVLTIGLSNRDSGGGRLR